MKRYVISIGVVLVVLLGAWSAFAQREGRTTGSRGQGREGMGMFQMLSPEEAARMRERWPNMSEEEREKFRAKMRERWQNMSEEERESLRAQLRERFGARGLRMGREEQLKAIEAIQEQVAKLKAVIEAMPGPEERSRWRDLSEEERTKLRERMGGVFRERQQAIGAIEEQIAKLRGPRPPSAESQERIRELRAIHALAVEEKAEKTAERLQRLIARYQRESGDRPREPGQRPERLDRPPRERPERPRGDVEGADSGKRAPAFTLTSFDGKTVNLSDYRGKIVVLEWLNFECPYSLYHHETTDTMVGLANKYKNKNVVWFAINSTSHTTPEANITFASRYKLPYMILDDRPGTVGHAYGAVTTPHMYIIDPRGNLVYEGAIDNSPLGRKKEGVINYVDKALAELTAGKDISTKNTKPYGCTVKYPR